MKKILLLLISISIFCVTENSLAQNENKLIEYNEFTELIDVTYFYENGAIMQKGSFNIDGLPHGLWMSYTMEGKELCSGNYKNGMYLNNDDSNNNTSMNTTSLLQKNTSMNTTSLLKNSDDTSGSIIGTMMAPKPKLKSCFSERKTTKKSNSPRVNFGSPAVAEFNRNTPPISLRKLTTEDAKKLFSMDGNKKILDDEEDIGKKRDLLKQHTNDVWNQVRGLSDRNYPLGLHKHLGKEGPDFTIMFIPNDEFLVRAERGVTKEQKKRWGHDSLEEMAISRNVFLCSPYGLRILANYTMKLWRGVGRNKELNELLELVQQVSEAVVETERTRSDHHKAMKELVSTWNKHIAGIESTDGRRSKPSFREAVSDLFRRVPSQQKSDERGKKGEMAGTIALSSDVSEPKSPSGISGADTSARLIDGEEE